MDIRGIIKNHWKKKTTDPLWCALGITLAVIVFYLLCGRAHYATNDDPAFCQIISGVYGEEYREYLIHINIILTKLLRLMFVLVPGINWYYFIQLGLSAACLTWFNYAFLTQRRHFVMVLYCLIFSFLLGNFHFRSLHFTQNAYLYITCAFFMLMHGMMDSRQLSGYRFTGAGLILLLCGGWLRFETLLALLPLGIILWGYLFFIGSETILSQIKRTIPLVCGILFLFITQVYHRSFYQNNGWNDYIAYDKYRITILDYSAEKLRPSSAELAQFNLNRVDLQMLASWLYADKEVFTMEKMQKISEFTYYSWVREWKKRFTGVELYFRVFCRMFGFMLFRGMGMGHLIVLWSIVLIFFGGIKHRLSLLLLASASVGLYSYLLGILNRINFRSEYGFWLFSLVFLSFMGCELDIFDKLQIALRRRKIHYIPVICIVFMLIFPTILRTVCSKFRHLYRYHAVNENYKKFYHYIGNQHGTSYCIDTTTLGQGYNAYPPWAIFPTGYSRQSSIPLGGWDVPSPRYMRQLQKAGIVNPFRSLAEGAANLYLVDDFNSDLIEEYIQEHYNSEAHKYLVKKLYSYHVWKFYDKESLAALSFPATYKPLDAHAFAVNHVDDEIRMEPRVPLAQLFGTRPPDEVFLRVHDRQHNLSSVIPATMHVERSPSGSGQDAIWFSGKLPTSGQYASDLKVDMLFKVRDDDYLLADIAM